MQRNIDTHPLDSDITTRNRTSRFIVLVAYIIISVLTFWTLGEILDDMFFENTTAQNVFLAVFVCMGIALTFASIEKLFIIRNPTTGMFVTIDQFRSILGLNEVNIPYGPGTHISYPWEVRLAENNISLEEAANEFQFTIQLKDGTIMGYGSFRLRPDPLRPVSFLTGVAAVADDIKDIIIADIAKFLSGKSVHEVSSLYENLNSHLSDRYGQSGVRNEIEERFGVDISDVTVNQMLPSKEVQRSISAIAEANAIQEGTLILLGISRNTLNKRLREGTLTQADVNLARDRFLSISGNLEGMEIKRSEFDISLHGLEPEAIKELVNLAKTPAAQAAAAAAIAAKKSGGKTKGTQASNKKRGEQ